MNKQILTIIFLTIIIITIQQVTAISLRNPTILSTNYNIYSIVEENDNTVMLSLFDNTAALMKYNSITGTYTRYDDTYTGYILGASEQSLWSTGYRDNYWASSNYEFYIIGDTQTPIYCGINASTPDAHEMYLYSRDRINNQWTLAYTWGAKATATYASCKVFNGWNFKDGTSLGNYNLIVVPYMATAGGLSAQAFYASTNLRYYWNSTSGTLLTVPFVAASASGSITSAQLGNYSNGIFEFFGEYIMDDAKQFQTSSNIFYDSKRLSTNYSKIDIGNPPATIGNGTFKSQILSNSKAYAIKNDRSKLIRFDSMSDLSNSSLITTSSCNLFYNLESVELNDIVCSSETLCLVGGQYSSPTIPILFAFDGNDCYNIPLSTSYNYTNKTIFNIEYMPTSGKFFIGGKGLFMEYNKDWIAIISNATTTPTPLCMPDTNYLCTYPLYSGNDLYCNIDNTYYCNLGCNNTVINGTTIGQCNEASTCTNECIFNGETINIDGYIQCINTVSFARCGNYDNDPCLELSTNNCANGEICAGVTCTAPESTPNEITYPEFVLNPTSTYSSIDNVNKKIIYTTTSLAVPSSWSIDTTATTSYVGTTCDYTETSIFNDTFNYATPYTLWSGGAYGIGTDVSPYNTYLLVNDTTEISRTFADTTDSILNIQTYLNTANNSNISGLYIKLYNDATLVKSFYIERISHLNSVCAYESNATDQKGSEVYCDSSISYNGDNIRIGITSNTKSTTIDMSHFTNIESYSGPLYFLSSDTAWNTIAFRAIDNTATIKVDNVAIKSITSPPAYKLTDKTSSEAVKCVYTSTKCRNMRTYLNYYNTPTYSNYITWNVCTNLNIGTGGIPDNEYENWVSTSVLNNLSTGGKLFILLVFLIIIWIVSIYIGHTANDTNIGIVIGGVLSVGTIIFASIPEFPIIGGFIPLWITITLALLIILLSVFLGMKGLTSGREG